MCSSLNCVLIAQVCSSLKCAHRSSVLIADRSPLALDIQMSTPKKAEDVRRVVLGSVVRRPKEETLEELRRLCCHDRRVVSSPIPRPASGTPHRFWVGQGPPLPTPPPRHAPINPAPSDDERRVQAAAMSARARRETEEYLRPLLEASSNAAPRRESPPRDVDDHYDLAKWGRRLTKWN